MPVDTFDIVASGTKSTGCLARHISEREQFILVGFVKVIVLAVIAIGAVLTKKVDITHLNLLDTLHFTFIILHHGVYPLTKFVSGYNRSRRANGLGSKRG